MIIFLYEYENCGTEELSKLNRKSLFEISPNKYSNYSNAKIDNRTNYKLMNYTS